MSTKSTIASGDGYHFYEDCFDDDNVYIALDGIDLSFEASPNFLEVGIPRTIFDAIVESYRKKRDVERKQDTRDDIAAVHKGTL